MDVCCPASRARTRPGLIREALLDGRVWWEPGPPLAMLRQWAFSVQNSHPLCMTHCAHRLHPMSRFERLAEAAFQLGASLAALYFIQETLLLYREYEVACDGSVPVQGNFTRGVEWLCEDGGRAFAPLVPVLGRVQLPGGVSGSYALGTLAGLLLSVFTSAISVALLALRRPCLRPWMDWPLKTPEGLHPTRARALTCFDRGQSCAVLAPWFGSSGACRGCVGNCTFNALSLLLRFVIAMLFAALCFVLLVERLTLDGRDSAGEDFVRLAWSYGQAMTLNWGVASLVLFALPVVLPARCRLRLGWDPFPLPFRQVLVAHEVPFPEEQVDSTVRAVPVQRGRVTRGPSKRGRGATPEQFLGTAVELGTQRAVSAMDEHATRGERIVGRGAAAAGGVGRVAASVAHSVRNPLPSVARRKASGASVPLATLVTTPAPPTSPDEGGQSPK